MSTQRDLGHSVLQVVFSIFLGLVVVAFVGIGVNTFLPEPPWSPERADAVFDSWRLTTSIVLLICATLVMLVSLVRSERWPVLANGALLGGLFTMIYAVGMGVSAGNQWPRFLVITLALVITVAVGWRRFGQRRAAPVPSTEGGGAALGVEAESRLAAVEAKLDALGRALRD